MYNRLGAMSTVMVEFRLGARFVFGNGDVIIRGFVGAGTNARAAERNAEDKAHELREFLACGTHCKMEIITSADECTADEMEEMKKDW